MASAPPAEMPFGFDTRVLARAQALPVNGSVIIALFVRRAAMICRRNTRWQTQPSKAISANEQIFALEISSRLCAGISRRCRLRIFWRASRALLFHANGPGGHGATHEAAFAGGIEADARADAANLTDYRSCR